MTKFVLTGSIAIAVVLLFSPQLKASDRSDGNPNEIVRHDDEGSRALTEVVDNDIAASFVIPASSAWRTGTWRSAGGGADAPLVAPAANVQSSVIDFHHVFDKSGFYVLRVRIPAIAGLAHSVRYVARIGNDKQIFSVNQSNGNGTFVRHLSFHAKAGDEFTLSYANDLDRDVNLPADRLVVADAIRLDRIGRGMSRLVLVGGEGDTLQVNCPKGKDLQLLRGTYGSIGSPHSCNFDERDARVFRSGQSVVIGNQLCGDPNWGTHKSVEIAAYCN